MAHAVELLVLQHPLEVAHPKGSARLLHLSLPHSRLVVGETFAPAVLADLLTQPFALPAPGEARGVVARRVLQGAAHSPRQPLLLYPPEPASLLASGAAGNRTHAAPAGPFMASPLVLPTQLRLVVLDGSWRKSRKMLHCNPQLAALPRLSLQGQAPSRYRIRKAHRAGQLSTLEAVCAALAQLEGDENRFAPLLAAFDGFVADRALRMQGLPPLVLSSDGP